jgi:hypothetical protein
MLIMLTPQPGEYNDDNTPDVHADRDPALALVVRRNDQRVIEKRLVQIGEIQSVLFAGWRAASVRPKRYS